MKNEPTRWLRLTSPYMQGDDVKSLQKGINDRLKARGRKGIVADGQYGPGTRDATRSVLWYLGMPSDELDNGATVKAQMIIRDPENRPQSWLSIAKDREEWLSKQDKGAKGFTHIVRGYLGKTEDPPGSNNGPWLDPLLKMVGFAPSSHPFYCAIGLIACYRKAGLDEVKNSWAYTPAWLADCRSGAMGWKLVPFSSRKPGDVLFYKFPGESNATVDHVGSVDDDTDFSQEFNTSSGVSGSQSNGGGCFRRDLAHDRSRFVVGVGRPPWGAAA